MLASEDKLFYKKLHQSSFTNIIKRFPMHFRLISTTLQLLFHFMLLDLLKACDLFAPSINLRYKRASAYPNICGGISSLLMMIAVLAIFNNSIREFIELQYVTFSTSQSSSMNYQVNLNNSNFKFAIGLTGLDLSTLKNPYFILQVQAITRLSNGTRINYPIYDLRPCQKQEWIQLGSEFQEYYVGNTLDKYLCSPSAFDFNLTGQFGSHEFSYLKLSIKPCKGNTWCSSTQQIIRKGKENGYMQMNFVYIDQQIQYQKTFKSIGKIPGKKYLRFTPSYQVASGDIFVEKVQISTDISVLPFSNTLIQKSHRFLDGTINNYVQGHSSDSEFCRVFIRVSDKSQNVSRQVQTLDSFLSFIGGIFSILQMIGFIMIAPIGQFMLFLDIFNSFHQFKHNTHKTHEEAINQYQNHPNQPTFNIFWLLFYKLIGLFKADFLIGRLNIKRLKEIQLVQNQVQKDLDFSRILSKIHFFQRTTELLFKEQHIYLLSQFNRKIIQDSNDSLLSQGFQPQRLISYIKKLNQQSGIQSIRVLGIIQDRLGLQTAKVYEESRFDLTHQNFRIDGS